MVDHQQIGDIEVTRVADGLVWSLRDGPFVLVSFEFQSWFEAECPWEFVHVETDIPRAVVVYKITNTRPMDRW